MKSVLVFVCVALCLVSSQVYFNADVVVSGDPTIPGGVINGHMNYFYNTSGFNHNIRVDWASPVSMTEQWVFGQGLHLRHCTQCFSETYKLLADQYFKLPTDTNGTTTFNGCKEYIRVGAYITNIWIDSANGAVCKAVVNGASGQRTIVFTNWASGVQGTLLTDWTGWNCPEPICNRVMDIMLVMDESGSIDTTEWRSAISFARNLVFSFNIDPSSVTMGVVFFGTGSRVISYLSANEIALNTSLNTARIGGWTCIGCGMSLGLSLFNFPVPGRTALNPAKIMIVLTDGYNNRPLGSYATNLTNSANNVHNAGIMTFAIGVGSSLSQAELETIASTLPTGEAVIRVSDFSQLNTIITQLISQTCTDLPAQPCGQTCYGFCSCNQTCFCPVCQNLGRCSNNNCTMQGGGTLGCIRTPVSCDDGDACTDDSCDDVLGCQHTTHVCDDGNPCTIDRCAPASGCYTDPRVCDDNSACTADSCNSSVPGGCVFKYLCVDNDACTVNTCNVVTGCGTSPTPCDDGNACTENLCNSTSGCYFPPKTCNDGKACTQDLCDPAFGCQFPPIDCEDGNICTANPCVEPGGCQNNTQPCVLCSIFSRNCTKEADPCQDGACVENVTDATCQFTDWVVTKCNSGNKCIHDSCNASTNECAHQAVECAYIPCSDVVCNTGTGLCDRTPRDCSTGDPCFVGYCDNSTDSCRSRPFCPSRLCKVASCTPAGPTCVYNDFDCSSGSMCMLDTCNNMTGLCVHLEVQCDDGLQCTDDGCNPATGCFVTNHSCDDSNPCTLDFCNETVGCYHTPACVDNQFCTDDICLPDGTCIFPEITCNLQFTNEEKKCFIAACSEKKRCYKTTSKSALLDVCGNCIDTFSNFSLANDTQAKTACVGSLTWPKFAATLTAAAIAGIIIAAIIGAIIVAVSGILGTRELLRRAKAAQNQAAVNNPLYADSGHEMTNPTYTGN